MCDVCHRCGEDTEEAMSSLSHVVTGEILLAFCCATPLLLLLCFLDTR
jgi:hypothetical protein